MKYIKNRLAWRRWVNHEYWDQNWSEEPAEYPCFVYVVVQSWGYQESMPKFVYRRDLEAMLKRIDAE